jgi:hypothetical protein
MSRRDEIASVGVGGLVYFAGSADRFGGSNYPDVMSGLLVSWDDLMAAVVVGTDSGLSRVLFFELDELYEDESKAEGT